MTVSDSAVRWLPTLGGWNAKHEGYKLAIVVRASTIAGGVVSLRIRKHDGGLLYDTSHTAATVDLAIEKAKADAQRMLKLNGAL